MMVVLVLTVVVSTLTVFLSQSVVAAVAGMLNLESLQHWRPQPRTDWTTDGLCQQPEYPRVDLPCVQCVQPPLELPERGPAEPCWPDVLTEWLGVRSKAGLQY